MAGVLQKRTEVRVARAGAALSFAPFCAGVRGSPPARWPEVQSNILVLLQAFGWRRTFGGAISFLSSCKNEEDQRT